jgi:hypothetical protein
MTSKAMAVVPIRQLLHEVQCQGFIVREDASSRSIVILTPAPDATWTPEVRALMARHEEAFDAILVERFQPQPELVKGGQSREEEEVRADARVFFVLGLATLVLGLAIGVIWLILPHVEAAK